MGVGGVPLLFAMIWAALIIIPFWKLLPRFGISKYFAVAAILPAIALVLLWIMAFKDDIEGRGA